MTRKIIGDGSHAALKQHITGHALIGSEDLPAVPQPAPNYGMPRVPATNRTMAHHPKAGPYLSNSPSPSAPRGQRDHAVEAAEVEHSGRKR
jgi:hypothetical protein